MAQTSRNDRGKGVSTSEDYGKAKFSNYEEKWRLEKAIEVNKGFIVEREMDFDLEPNAQFVGIYYVIVALRWKMLIKKPDATIDLLFGNVMLLLLMLLIM